jgi:hypothetical protein
VYANYKPTEALSASGFMSDLLPDYGLVSNGIYIGMITKLLLVDTRGSLRVIFSVFCFFEILKVKINTTTIQK